MARYNGRLHCIVGVLPTCYKRKAATYFYPPGWHGAFCGIIFNSDMIKFNASNEKMLNGERFITGYTKSRLLVGEQICVCQSGVSNSTSSDLGLVLSTVAQE